MRFGTSNVVFLQHNCLVVDGQSGILISTFTGRKAGTNKIRNMVFNLIAGIFHSRTFNGITVFLLTLILPLSAVSAGGPEPSITSIRITQGEEHVLLSTTLDPHLDDEMKEAVRAGVPLKFRFKVKLTRKGSLLGEKVVRNEDLTHTLHYNPIKKLYVFKGEGYGENREKTTRDELEAFTWMTEITEWPMYPLEDLRNSVRYRVRVMATLRSVELPSVFGYLFFFTTIFNSETNWRQLDFTY